MKHLLVEESILPHTFLLVASGAPEVEVVAHRDGSVAVQVALVTEVILIDHSLILHVLDSLSSITDQLMQ